MITAYVGIPGTGKTLGAVQQAVLLWRKNRILGNLDYRIYANINLYLPEPINEAYTKIKSYDMIKGITNGVFLFDEMWDWVDSRVPMSNQNRFWSRWSIQTRKTNLDLLYTEQYELLIDVRIRKITQFICRPHQEDINYELTYTNKYRREVYNYTIIQMVPLKDPTAVPQEYIIENKLWFDKFDTMEVPEELSGGTYIDEARDLIPKVAKDSVIDLYETKGEQTGHIEKFYGVSQQTARLVWYCLYKGEGIKSLPKIEA